MKITHYYRYNSRVAEVYGLPLAEIETRHIRGDYPFKEDGDDPSIGEWMQPKGLMSKIYNADKVWRKIGDNPIEVYKSRDGSYEFDETEFAQMLFLAEIAGPVSLGA